MKTRLRRGGSRVAIGAPARLVRDGEPAGALGNRRFPWLSGRRIELLMCPVDALRVAYTGELGWATSSTG